MTKSLLFFDYYSFINLFIQKKYIKINHKCIYKWIKMLRRNRFSFVITLYIKIHFK